jgi:GT2 family glycosyltransferase
MVFVNNNTLPTPGWLEKMLALAGKEPRVGIVGSKLLFPDGRIQHMGVVFDECKNPKHIYRGFPADIPPAGISREYQAVTGACLLVVRDLYRSVGGMDESYKNSFEDIDLCLKVRGRGYRVFVCADSVLYHFESLTEGRHTADFRNAALFKARCGNGIECDANRWYTLDNLRDEVTEFEAPEGYDPMQEPLLEDLWKRVYSCAFPNGSLAPGRAKPDL